jgi:hypothetical protein
VRNWKLPDGMFFQKCEDRFNGLVLLFFEVKDEVKLASTLFE